MTKTTPPLSFSSAALAANFERALSYQAPARIDADEHDRPPNPRAMTLFELIDYAARGCPICAREMAERARRGARH